MRKTWLRATLSLSLLLSPGAMAWAADFYEGKTITIVVGFTTGGTYDQMARFYARHLPRFLPGKPTVIVQSMPGAGSMVATSHLYNTANRDGTTLGIIGGGTVWEAILGNPQARYDPRQFNWIGGKSRDNITCLVWHTSPIKTIQDALSREVVVGGTGPGSRTLSFPRALNNLVGTKFKIVSGYPGGNEITLALEKGEVEGYCGWALGSLKQRASAWYDEKKVRFLVQFAA
ncbi:MAG: tripartite tricarboxylate transporter family receptor, partial [Hyphomicrobiales bacterium]|nr:tripartite tricarboxylate transporter family receptor [Hyphomicrobiales bacterium]